MKPDTNKMKKKRKVSDVASENPVKKKKSKNKETSESSSLVNNESVETNGYLPQQQPGKIENKKAKKKRKVEGTVENCTIEKKTKMNDPEQSVLAQNGTMHSNSHSDPHIADSGNVEDPENVKLSNKEMSKLSGKSLRKSFNSREGLEALRKFLAVCKENKEKDLAAEYLQVGGSVLEILRLLDTSDKKNVNNASCVFAAMHLVIMKILSEYPQYQSNAEEACRHFINSHLSFVHSMLSSQSNAKHRKIVLRLLASMVSLGGGLPRELLGHLSFHSQVLDTLSQQTKPTDSQSVRTCFIHFLLAFLVEGNSSVIRAFLEKRGMLSCIFAELIYDPHTTVHLVLDTVKTWVLENSAISKTSKLRVFSTPILQSLVSLYNWKGPKNWPGPKPKKHDTTKDIVNPEEKEIVVEALHNFLKTLLTSNRHGVIFHDRTLGTSGRKCNQLVNTVLQSLDRPWEHARPRDLVIGILTACPDLVRSQLAYTEPFLEPRASKKWILAMRFVGELLDSLKLDNCLKPCLSELSSSQLISAVQNLTIPSTILKNAIVRSLSDVDILIRNEAVVLLAKMLQRAKDFAKIVEDNCHETDFLSFRQSLIDYIAKNVPSLESLLDVWNSALSPEEKSDLASKPEEILEFIPRRKSHVTAILDLLQAYRDVCPEPVDLTACEDNRSEILLKKMNELQGIEREELTEMKVKALKFLLSIDPPAFTPEKTLFGQTLLFLITLLDHKENEAASRARETLKMFLSSSGMFEGCLEQMDIWIESFACLENEEETIHAGNWFVKIVKRAMKKTDKYLDRIVEAEEEAGEDLVVGGHTEDIFNDLYERDFENADSRITTIAPMTSITPILCSAFESQEKNHDEIIAKYLTRVTVLTLHCQVTPGTIVNLARVVPDFPAEKYLTSWLLEEIPRSVEELFPPTSSVAKLSEILVNNEKLKIEEIFRGDRTLEFEDGDKKIILHHELGSYEVATLLRMNIFYLGQFIQRKEFSRERFDSHKSLTIILLRVAKDLDNGGFDLVEKCSRTFFSNPILLQCFSPFCKTKNIVGQIVTSGLLDICRIVRELNDPNAQQDYFLPFKNKLIAELRGAAKKFDNAGKIKAPLFLMEFMEILRPTTKDVVDLLKIIVNLPESNFLNNELSPKVWGYLVPKLIEFLTRAKDNGSEDLTIDASVVKKIVWYLARPIFNRKFPIDAWEDNLRKYLERFPRNIAGIDGHAFKALLKIVNTPTKTNLLSFLISRNDQYIPLFVTHVLTHNKIRSQGDQIFSIITSRLSWPWSENFLKKISDTYKNDVVHFFAKPSSAEKWVGSHVKAACFVIDSCFEREDCDKACETVLSNGDKLDTVNLGYIELLETLFKKAAKFENNFEESLRKLLHVLLRIMVSALKKDSKNEDKLEILCKGFDDTINRLRSKNRDLVLEDLNKNHSWPQFTRFSLKLGLKNSKTEEKRFSLLKTLVGACDIAYKDRSENEYVQTLFEMTTSHSEFVNIMLSSQNVKRDLLELLWVLVRKNHSTMSSSQIPLYLAAYNATLEESDQFILMILQHYESNQIKFNEYRPYLWGEAAATHYSVKGEADTALWRQPSTSQVLDLFNPETIKATIKRFPVHRELKPSGPCEAEKVYDPAFYLPLLSYLLSDNNVVACHKLTQSGALALVFAASGSSCSEIRLAAYTVVSRFYFHLEATSSKEKHLWIRFVDALRNGILNINSSLKDVRMSCLVSTFLARASVVTTQPMNVLYAPIQAFFMAKPALELNAIPELLQLFHSSDIEHEAHRHWILGTIRDGMRTNFDMDVAVKCFLFKMLMDFHSSVLSDPVTRRLILQIIESTAKIPKAGLLLARSYGLLVWLNEITRNFNARDTETISIVISIVREILSAAMGTNDRDKDTQFLLLNVLRTLKTSLSKNTSVACYDSYTSSLAQIISTKSFRPALSRDDLEEIVELGKQIYGDVEEILEILRHGGEFSDRMEHSKAENDELTMGKISLRKLVLTWCGHATR